MCTTKENIVANNVSPLESLAKRSPTLLLRLELMMMMTVIQHKIFHLRKEKSAFPVFVGMENTEFTQLLYIKYYLLR